MILCYNAVQNFLFWLDANALIIHKRLRINAYYTRNLRSKWVPLSIDLLRKM